MPGTAAFLRAVRAPCSARNDSNPGTTSAAHSLAASSALSMGAEPILEAPMAQVWLSFDEIQQVFSYDAADARGRVVAKPVGAPQVQ
jgi:hypothetical protein